MSELRPYVFAVGPDGHLLVDAYDGLHWTWTDLGAAAGEQADPRALTATRIDGNPAAFVRTVADEQLTLHFRDAGGWQHEALGAPASGLAGPFAATGDGPEPSVWTLDADGQAWLCRRSGGLWAWRGLGSPYPAGALGTGLAAVTLPDGVGLAAVGADGVLYLATEKSGGWRWSEQGSAPGGLIGGGPAAVTFMDRPYVFVTAAGRLSVDWWDGTGWRWADLGAPDQTTIVGPLAATRYAGRPYLFAWGDDPSGNAEDATALWVCFWDGAAWRWSAQGRGEEWGAGAHGALAALVHEGRPYVFANQAVGLLWSNWWDGNAWRWTSDAPPANLSLGTGPIAAVEALAR